MKSLVGDPRSIRSILHPGTVRRTEGGRSPAGTVIYCPFGMPDCYRHPGVETGVSCSSCGRPICPDCMTPTPVGMRCPECSRQKTRVVRAPAAGEIGDWPATKVLIALCVLAYFGEIATGSGGLSPGSSSLLEQFGLRGFAVADGEWYRLVTCGFLHVSIFHLAFNMIALFFLGRILEPSIGTARFVGIYFASLLAGSFGAILLSGSVVNTVGASGAVFGIFGATFVIARGRGLDHIAREIGVILGINLLLTFTISGISIGGHLGGLVGGVICGALVIAGERGRLGSNPRLVEFSAIVLVALVSVVGAVSVARPLAEVIGPGGTIVEGLAAELSPGSSPGDAVGATIRPDGGPTAVEADHPTTRTGVTDVPTG